MQMEITITFKILNNNLAFWGRNWQQEQWKQKRFSYKQEKNDKEVDAITNIKYYEE